MDATSMCEESRLATAEEAARAIRMFVLRKKHGNMSELAHANPSVSTSLTISGPDASIGMAGSEKIVETGEEGTDSSPPGTDLATNPTPASASLRPGALRSVMESTYRTPLGTPLGSPLASPRIVSPIGKTPVDSSSLSVRRLKGVSQCSDDGFLLELEVAAHALERIVRNRKRRKPAERPEAQPSSTSVSSSTKSKSRTMPSPKISFSSLPLRFLTSVSARFSLPPRAMFRPRPTVESILDKRLLRYNRDFFDGSVLMAYKNLKLAQSGAIFNGSPQITLSATFDALVFQPQVGANLVGHVNKLGRGHIGMLVAGIFNASIPNSGGAILTDYSYDSKGGVWRSPQRIRNSSADLLPASIQLKSEIVFCVDRVTESNGMFSICGRMQNTSSKTHSRQSRISDFRLSNVEAPDPKSCIGNTAGPHSEKNNIKKKDEKAKTMAKAADIPAAKDRRSLDKKKGKRKKRKRELNGGESESTDDQTEKMRRQKKKRRTRRRDSTSERKN